jgi:hypothetical protein
MRQAKEIFAVDVEKRDGGKILVVRTIPVSVLGSRQNLLAGTCETFYSNPW